MRGEPGRRAPEPHSLLTQLAHVARACGERVAFVEGERRTTYAELWGQVERIGLALRHRIQPGEPVVIVMDNCAELAATIYATWWAGGIAAALNPALKAPDLLALAQSCGARWALLDPAMPTDAWQGGGVTALALDGGLLEPLAAPPFEASPCPYPTPLSSTAALIFTSGTTGQPKGVMLSHGNLASNVAAVQASLPMRADDVTLCVLPFHYAYGGSVLHTHLALGATLVLENSFMYPQRITQRMAQCRVTAFHGVPSSYYLLLERGQLASADLQSLRYVAQAGGPMDPARIDAFCALLPWVDFWVMYGQTEACSRLTTLPAHERLRKQGSVGRPLPGVELRVVGPDGNALPCGEVGEVCARGDNVMQGYWQAPQDTAATLQGGWLRTGDIGHLDDEGFLFLHGRSRDIIKAGAHRVAPQEIEQVIQSVPGVQECAVVAMPDHLLGEVIRACIVPAQDAPEASALARDVLRTCRERLPLYKMPRHVDCFDALPRTASGKIQKHLIPARSGQT